MLGVFSHSKCLDHLTSSEDIQLFSIYVS